MIECIFTIDYEIYGDGHGDLSTLVYEPTRRLQAVFAEADAKLVTFVEALEFGRIETAGTDPYSQKIRDQILELHRDGHELALHLHPQWSNAVYRDNKWELDNSEYNLCTLSIERIGEIVDVGLAYLRSVTEDAAFLPCSFRAGNWLFQPSQKLAQVLFDRGIRVDSSVFKGGIIHKYGIDYRRALENEEYWWFDEEVTESKPEGRMLQLPIHTRMVPSWHMLTTKRLGSQRKSNTSSSNRSVARNLSLADHVSRLRDLSRFSFPLKFDFCRMTLAEMINTVERALAEDKKTPRTYRPLVSIGHSKDPIDFDAVGKFLKWLSDAEIPVVTLRQAYAKCMRQKRDLICAVD